ncbi:hypothetical protein NLI96_g11035 [Meripilus lineatus]|uniref:Uncharacterized protein n=1 Tax=Meripilus lineatus TaxID=2056292 RepID=A0AAD5UTZ6_9APHY|nr:hypothetical protein NLI96_g11035 [Physisporinus lineatus]
MPPSVIVLSDDEEKNLAVATILVQDEDIPHFPDGGLRAWLVVAGAYIVLFSTFGVVNTYVCLQFNPYGFLLQS